MKWMKKHQVPKDKLSGLSQSEKWEKIRQNHVCNEATLVDTCTNELHPNCMKFVKSQIRIRIQGFFGDYFPSNDYLKNAMPQCVKYFLEEKNEYTKEKDEYPIFNKLVSELNLIKNVLKNKNVN